MLGVNDVSAEVIELNWVAVDFLGRKYLESEMPLATNVTKPLLLSLSIDTSINQERIEKEEYRLQYCFINTPRQGTILPFPHH